jgi:hypothetical protein
MASCSKLGDRHWLEILSACVNTASESQVASDELADLLLLDQQHGMLFEFSSPIRGSVLAIRFVKSPFLSFSPP